MAQRRSRSIVAVLVAAALLAGIAPTAMADEYDPETAGNPVRIAAYILHPIGVIIDVLVLRPAHFVVMHEPFKTLFGHTDHADTE